MSTSPPPDPELFVDAFARGLSVICAFDASRPELTLSEVAELTGISRAAARRLLSTLVHLGYVHASGRSFRLTPKVMKLGYAYLSGQALTDIVEHYVVDVAEKTGESCSVCVLDGSDVVYIARASTKKIMTINLSIGTRLPAWPTATGRVLLSSLEEAELLAVLEQSEITKHSVNTITERAALLAAIASVRTAGYSFVSQELEYGLTAVAVPLRDRSGKVIAAMNVAGHVHRNSPEQMLNHHLPLLQRAATEINAALASQLMSGQGAR
ncbi:IclR family transcriptional regulator domain-containing protein [Undibacterium terreum]|uniref:Transcriptional regulator n=1 Tax=Undibacterium terreum TaxID=1224302 RepID=A0A916XFI4_9BURK|nr:IclR family transcriptional regulator C-terminal domain-containing protein [Undibacterium terreum]GGC69624.1 transcriptional regulator [Undibacterium terreum]